MCKWVDAQMGYDREAVATVDGSKYYIKIINGNKLLNVWLQIELATCPGRIPPSPHDGRDRLQQTPMRSKWV